MFDKNDISDMKKVNRIDDSELENISGGWMETNEKLATYRKNIVCPNCQADKRDQFEDIALQDDKLNSVEYHCSKCGCQFVCYQDLVILKGDWIKKCNEKNYRYPYQ